MKRKKRKRLEEPDFPAGWEMPAGSVGYISLINYPELTPAETKKFRKQLEKAEKRKIQLGFPIPKEDA